MFLGSASAFSIPQTRLLEVLGQVHEIFGPWPRGIATFYEPEHAPDRRVKDYRRLFEAGLSCVTLGLETKHAPLRKFWGKDAKLKRFVDAVYGLKEAGFQCALTVLVGMEPGEFSAEHRTDTVALLRTLPLEERDIVYLSPDVLKSRSEAVKSAVETFRMELRQPLRAKVSLYDFNRFRYFS